MCDVKKYEKIYKDCKSLNMDDYYQLMNESSNDEEKEFFIFLSNFFVQKNQEKFVAEGKF